MDTTNQTPPVSPETSPVQAQVDPAPEAPVENEAAKEEQQEVTPIEQPAETNAANTCPDCLGGGLKDEYTRCPNCLGTGKVE